MRICRSRSLHRHDPDFVAPERQTLVEFLDYYRTVLLRKAAGLSQAQLAVSV